MAGTAASIATRIRALSAPAAPKAPERGATLIDTLRKLGAAQYIIDACIKADAERGACGRCGGTGRVHHSVATFNCPACGGKGTT